MQAISSPTKSIKCSATKYLEFKTRLLDLFKESENTRIKKLISGIDLGNLKPSQLLQKLKSGNFIRVIIDFPSQ